MPVTYSVHRHPYMVCVGAVERQLCVGSDGNIPEPDLMREIHHIVDRVDAVTLLVFPKIQFAAFEIHEPCSETVTILQFGTNLREGLDARIGERIDRTMPASEVALVEDEDDGLQRSPASEPTA